MVCNVKPEVCFSDLHQVLEEEAMTSESKIKQQSSAFDNISAAAAFDDSSADHDTACDADAALMTSVASGAWGGGDDIGEQEQATESTAAVGGARLHDPVGGSSLQAGCKVS